MNSYKLFIVGYGSRTVIASGFDYLSNTVIYFYNQTDDKLNNTYKRETICSFPVTRTLILSIEKDIKPQSHE